MSDPAQRINNIIRNEEYRKKLSMIKASEHDRKFCRHTLEHFLDTARIMYITALESSLPLEKDIIYAAALLHDIGRADEYESGLPHDEASAISAAKILPECGYSSVETETVVNAILCHRKDGSNSELGELLRFADKKSRLCFNCQSADECYWSEEKKHGGITV